MIAARRSCIRPCLRRTPTAAPPRSSSSGSRPRESSLDLIVPKEDLTSFEAAQTGASLTTLLGSLQSGTVSLALPKLKLQPKDDGSIKEALSALGMSSAFDGSADFGLMIPGEALQLSDVVHKTFVEIDETGLEAAAATGGGFVTSGGTGALKIMTVDRPFLMVLRDVPTGQILFLGHIADPTAP